MNGRQITCLIAGAALALATPATAAPENAAQATGQALARLQFYDARLQTIGWRLVTGNAPFCANARPAVGLLLQDMKNYGDPAGARNAARIAGDIAVQAVAGGSPAALAGIAPNDEVLAIAGHDMAALPPASAGDYRRLLALHDRIDAELARTGRVALKLRGHDGAPRDVVLAGVAACPSRFEIVTGTTDAQADGHRVQMGHRFGKAARATDAMPEEEYAAIVAHELAHNLLGHPALLDRIGRGWNKVLSTEREADRLAIWLLANAGFDPQAGPRVMASWGRRRDLGLLRTPTHAGWRDRMADMQTEVTRLQAALTRHGAADWTRWFTRENHVAGTDEAKMPDASSKIG